MLQLIYASAAKVKFTRNDLKELLLRARQNNASLNVTGMLVYQDGAFLQILEGDEENVLDLYNRISQDSRHCNVLMLLRTNIEERSFGDWKMGFYDASGSELKGLLGFCDFFETGRPFNTDDIDRARSVLLKFREGSWHQKVEDEALT